VDCLYAIRKRRGRDLLSVTECTVKQEQCVLHTPISSDSLVQMVSSTSQVSRVQEGDQLTEGKQVEG